jgi:hypothetical protein
MRLRMCFFKYLIGCIMTIGSAFADPVPAVPDTTSMPKIWDNLNGTAGEPLSLYDVYLVGSGNVRATVLLDPLRTTHYWDSTSNLINFGSVYYDFYPPKVYSRINMPISIGYGITRSLEIEFRRAFVTRRKFNLFMPESLLGEKEKWIQWENASGMGDISFRLRTKILGAPDKLLYTALGVGIKFASSDEFEPNEDLPISPGSTDIFFGIYNAIKLGKFILPAAVTYSHTGRYLNSYPMGEIITYQIGLIAPIHRFVDFNLSLRGFAITPEAKSNITLVDPSLSSSIIDKTPEIIPQGISQTSAEVGLSLKILKIPIILSGGILSDLRGKRTFQEDIAAVFSLQVGF